MHVTVFGSLCGFGYVGAGRTMGRMCTDAALLNYSNPMHKVCDAITTLSKTRCVGLCHGAWMEWSRLDLG